MDTDKKPDEILTEIRHGGVIVYFEPISVSLDVLPGRYHGQMVERAADQLVLSYRVCLEQRHRSGSVTGPSGVELKWEGMTLATGEKFEALDCRIRIFLETNKLKNRFCGKDCGGRARAVGKPLVA